MVAYFSETEDAKAHGERFGGYDFGGSSQIPSTDNFTIRILPNDPVNGVPDGTVAFQTASLLAGTLTRNQVGTLGGGLPIFEYSVDIAPLTVPAGTSAWLSIVNNTPGLTSDWLWATANSAVGNAAQRSVDGTLWSTIPSAREFAFNLTVPEPSAFVVCLSLMGGVVLRVRTKRVA